MQQKVINISKQGCFIIIDFDKNKSILMHETQLSLFKVRSIFSIKHLEITELSFQKILDFIKDNY